MSAPGILDAFVLMRSAPDGSAAFYRGAALSRPLRWIDARRDAERMPHSEATRLAHDFNQWAASKGYALRHTVERAPCYLIANEASDGATLTFRAYTPGGRGRWAAREASARRWQDIDDARAELAQLEAERVRAGRRFVVEEIDTPDGPAHA